VNSIKLSIVVICWNDEKYILDCLRSIYGETSGIAFEVIVADNGSADASVPKVRRKFPAVRVIENGSNLGFGAGNNAGIRAATGEYVLILNPDTVIRGQTLVKLIDYADKHPEAGAFGCRVLNVDASLQYTAQPAPTIIGYLMGALCLRTCGRLLPSLLSDRYPGWDGTTEREIGFQAACCLLVRNEVLRALGGFDEGFSHQFEDADLCRRVWQTGKKVLFYPGAEVTHVGGHNRGGYPLSVLVETEKSKYRYFGKHFGNEGLAKIRYVSLLHFALRYFGYRLIGIASRAECVKEGAATFVALLKWHWQANPAQFLGKCEPSYDPVVSEAQQKPAGTFV
jgi:N-acetylglucosaminyl-diphospho-decaprenol L-rhamnosyltransferase